MRTITEYQPWSSAPSSAKPTAAGPRRPDPPAHGLGLLLAYAVLALKITADTGLAAWNWQFWLIFAPLFVLGERLLQLIARVFHFTPEYLERSHR